MWRVSHGEIPMKGAWEWRGDRVTCLSGLAGRLHDIIGAHQNITAYSWQGQVTLCLKFKEKELVCYFSTEIPNSHLH